MKGKTINYALFCVTYFCNQWVVRWWLDWWLHSLHSYKELLSNMWINIHENWLKLIMLMQLCRPVNLCQKHLSLIHISNLLEYAVYFTGPTSAAIYSLQQKEGRRDKAFCRYFAATDGTTKKEEKARKFKRA